MKPLLVILAALAMIGLGVFVSMSKYYMKWLAFSLALPMAKWQTLALMLFSQELYRGSSRGMEVALPYLLAFAMMLALIIRSKAGAFFADGGSVLFVLYWLSFFPSLMNCDNLLYAWFEIWKVAMIFMVYRAVRGYCVYTRDYTTPLYGFLLVSVINFLCVVYQHFIVHVSQARGVFDHQNSMAMWNVLAGAIFFAAYLNRKTSMMWRLMAVCFVMSTAACFRAYSRGSMVSLPIALAIVSLLSLFRNFHVTQVLRVGLLVLVCAFGAALAMPKIIARFSGASPRSARMRVVFAQAAMRMVADHPVAGVGLNNWGIKINPPYEYSKHRDEFKMPPHYKDGIVETIYLLTWAECGTLCFILLLALFFWHWYKAFRLTKFNRDKDDFWISVGCFGGLSAVYLQSFLEWVLRQSINFTQLAICFGVIAAMNAVHEQEEKEHRKQLKREKLERMHAADQAAREATPASSGAMLT